MIIEVGFLNCFLVVGVVESILCYILYRACKKYQDDTYRIEEGDD